MDNRRINENYQAIAQELIETEDALIDIKNSNVQIIFLSSEHKKQTKNSIIFGVCERVQDKNKWAIPADFTITVFEPNVVDFTEDQIKILLFQELLHVGIEFKDGFETYSCKPHDLEDFKYIIDRFGTDWESEGVWKY